MKSGVWVLGSGFWVLEWDSGNAGIGGELVNGWLAGWLWVGGMLLIRYI